MRAVIFHEMIFLIFRCVCVYRVGRWHWQCCYSRCWCHH